MAKAKRTSANKVLLALVEKGLEAQESEKERFFALAEKLVHSRDRSERELLKKELARITFG